MTDILPSSSANPLDTSSTSTNISKGTVNNNGSVIKSMVDRFRYGSPLSRAERDKLREVNANDFWWKKEGGTVPNISNASSVSNSLNASYVNENINPERRSSSVSVNKDDRPPSGLSTTTVNNGSSTMIVNTPSFDPNASFASYLPDTQPSASYRYANNNNASVPSTPGTINRPIMDAEAKLQQLTARIFQRHPNINNASNILNQVNTITNGNLGNYSAPRSTASSSSSNTVNERPLPASATIVAEDLVQALASFKHRFKVYEYEQNEEDSDEDTEDDVEPDTELDGANGNMTMKNTNGDTIISSVRTSSSSIPNNRNIPSSTSAGNVQGTNTRSLSSSSSNESTLVSPSRTITGLVHTVSSSASSAPTNTAIKNSIPPLPINDILNTSVNLTKGIASSTARSSSGSNNKTNEPNSTTASTKDTSSIPPTATTTTSRRRHKEQPAPPPDPPLATTLSALAESLDMSMLCLSRRLAAISGDTGIMKETAEKLTASGTTGTNDDNSSSSNDKKDTVTKDTASKDAKEASSTDTNVAGSDDKSSINLNNSISFNENGNEKERQAWLEARRSWPALATGKSSMSDMDITQFTDNNNNNNTTTIVAKDGNNNNDTLLSATGSLRASMNDKKSTLETVGEKLENVRQSLQVSTTFWLDAVSAALRGDVEGTLAALEGRNSTDNGNTFNNAVVTNSGSGSNTVGNGKNTTNSTASVPSGSTKDSILATSNSLLSPLQARATRLGLSLQPDGRLSPEMENVLKDRRSSVKPLNTLSSPSSSSSAAVPSTTSSASSSSTNPSTITAGTTAAVPTTEGTENKPITETSTNATAPSTDSSSTSTATTTVPATDPATASLISAGPAPVNDTTSMLITAGSASLAIQDATKTLTRDTTKDNSTVPTGSTLITPPDNSSSFIPLTAFIPPVLRPKAIYNNDGTVSLSMGGILDPYQSIAASNAIINGGGNGKPPTAPSSRRPSGTQVTASNDPNTTLSTGNPLTTPDRPLILPPALDFSAVQAQANGAMLGYSSPVPPPFGSAVQPSPFRLPPPPQVPKVLSPTGGRVVLPAPPLSPPLGYFGYGMPNPAETMIVPPATTLLPTTTIASFPSAPVAPTNPSVPSTIPVVISPLVSRPVNDRIAASTREAETALYLSQMLTQGTTTQQGLSNTLKNAFPTMNLPPTVAPSSFEQATGFYPSAVRPKFVQPHSTAPPNTQTISSSSSPSSRSYGTLFTQQRSPVSMEVDNLLAAHKDIEMNAQKILGKHPNDLITENERARIQGTAMVPAILPSRRTNNSGTDLPSPTNKPIGLSLVAPKALPDPVPSMYASVAPPSSSTVEAQVAVRRAQQALQRLQTIRSALTTMGSPTNGSNNGVSEYDNFGNPNTATPGSRTYATTTRTSVSSRDGGKGYPNPMMDQDNDKDYVDFSGNSNVNYQY